MCNDNLDKEYRDYILEFFNCDFEELSESRIMTKEEFVLSRNQENRVEKDVK